MTSVKPEASNSLRGSLTLLNIATLANVKISAADAPNILAVVTHMLSRQLENGFILRDRRICTVRLLHIIAPQFCADQALSGSPAKLDNYADLIWRNRHGKLQLSLRERTRSLQDGLAGRIG